MSEGHGFGALMHPMLRKLEEGDGRPVGRSNEVVAEVLARCRKLLAALESGRRMDA